MRLESARFNLLRIKRKFFLTCVSVKGCQPFLVLYWNRGWLLEPGVIKMRFFNALTGQMRFAPKLGIFKIFTMFRDCIVLDHFIRTWIPGCAKIISPLAK